MAITSKMPHWHTCPGGHRPPVMSNTTLQVLGPTCAIFSRVWLWLRKSPQFLKTLKTSQCWSHWFSIAMNTNDQPFALKMLCSLGFHGTISLYVSGPSAQVLQGLLKSLFSSLFPSLLLFWEAIYWASTMSKNLFSRTYSLGREQTYNKLVIATPSDLSCRGDTQKAIWSTLPDGEGDDGKGRVFRGEGQVHKADEGSLCKGTKMWCNTKCP